MIHFTRTKRFRAATVMLVLAALGGCNLLRPTTPEAVERILLDDKEGGTMYATLKRTYPQEFDGLTREIARRSANFQTNEAIGSAAKSYILAAMTRHVGELAQAPHDALSAYRQAEIAVISAVKAADVARCATYFRTGVIDFPVPPSAVREAMIKFEVTSWKGFAAGRDRPAKRAVLQPNHAASEAIGHAVIATGIDNATYNSVVNGGMAQDADRCRIGIAILQAVDGLPPEQADNFTAFLASRAGVAKP